MRCRKKLTVYTDASADPDSRSGAFAGVAFLDGEEIDRWAGVLAASFPGCAGNSGLSELAGLSVAVRRARRLAIQHSLVEAIVCSDSRSALQMATTASPIDHPEGERLRHRIRDVCHYRHPAVKIHLEWVRRIRNIAADRISKLVHRKSRGIRYRPEEHIHGVPKTRARQVRGPGNGENLTLDRGDGFP